MDTLNEIGKVTVVINGEKREETIFERQAGFDGQTGEPVIETVVASGFDGQTGEKIYSAVEKSGFDPMSGEPLYRLKVNDTVSSGKGKFKAGKKTLFMGIAAVIVLALVVCVMALSGVFMGKHEKILLAAYNTLNDDVIGKSFINAVKVFDSDELTAKVESSGKISGANFEVNALLATDFSDGKVYSEGEIDAAGVNQSYKFLFDSDSVRLALPDMTDSVYVYDYTKKNNGYLAEVIEDNTRFGKTEDINNSLRCLNTIYKKSHKATGKIKKEVLKAIKKIEITDIEPAEIEIDEKYRKCKGYEVHITSKNIAEIMKAVSKVKNDAYGKDIDKLVSSLENLGIDEAGTLSARYENDFESLENIGEIDFSVYVYGGKLAGIEYVNPYSGRKVEMEFNGGDKRTSNMTSKSGGVKVRRSSEISDGVETGILSVGNSKLKYSYDVHTGEYMLVSEDEKREGIFKSDGKSIDLTYQSYYPQMDVSISVSKGTKIPSVKGNVFDLGKADQEEFEEEFEFLMKDLWKFGSFFGNMY